MGSGISSTAAPGRQDGVAAGRPQGDNRVLTLRGYGRDVSRNPDLPKGPPGQLIEQGEGAGRGGKLTYHVLPGGRPDAETQVVDALGIPPIEGAYQGVHVVGCPRLSRRIARLREPPGEQAVVRVGDHDLIQLLGKGAPQVVP